MAVNMTIKFDGLQGESKVQEHEGEIDVLSWSWNMTQQGSMHIGGGGGSGKVSVGDIAFTKYVDKATPTLIMRCCLGQHFTEAVLTCRKATGDLALDFVKLTMEKVVVTSVDCGAGGDETPIENVTLQFAKFTYEYTPQKDDGSGEAAIDKTFNIEKNVEE